MRLEKVDDAGSDFVPLEPEPALALGCALDVARREAVLVTRWELTPHLRVVLHCLLLCWKSLPPTSCWGFSPVPLLLNPTVGSFGSSLARLSASDFMALKAFSNFLIFFSM